METYIALHGGHAVIIESQKSVISNSMQKCTFQNWLRFEDMASRQLCLQECSKQAATVFHSWLALFLGFVFALLIKSQ